MGSVSCSLTKPTQSSTPFLSNFLGLFCNFVGLGEVGDFEDLDVSEILLAFPSNENRLFFFNSLS